MVPLIPPHGSEGDAKAQSGSVGRAAGLRWNIWPPASWTFHSTPRALLVSQLRVSRSATSCFSARGGQFLLGEYEAQKPGLINRLLPDSVIILKGGLFMKESQIRKQPIKPRHIHAGAQLKSLYLNSNYGPLHVNICGDVVLMALKTDIEGLSLDYGIHPFIHSFIQPIFN